MSIFYIAIYFWINYLHVHRDESRFENLAKLSLDFFSLINTEFLIKMYLRTIRKCVHLSKSVHLANWIRTKRSKIKQQNHHSLANKIVKEKQSVKKSSTTAWKFARDCNITNILISVDSENKEKRKKNKKQYSRI